MQIKEELEKLGYTVDVNLGKDGVTGSNPVSSSKKHRKRLFTVLFFIVNTCGAKWHKKGI
ncbi:MAG: hypothetical protein GX236_03290, partial [Clostridiaceae bacterium]|nr:hypothetical protein [Clostridiaceae bacterium]